MAQKTEKFGKGIKFDPANQFPKGFESLSDREKKYFKMMNAKSGVLYITSAPGYAKSAIMRSIASKMGYQYFDIRLSMVDETDVGLFPTIDEQTIDGTTQRMLCHVAPKWAYIANGKHLSILDLENKQMSSLSVSDYDSDTYRSRNIDVQGNFVYLARYYYNYGMGVYFVKDKQNPYHSGSYDFGTSYAYIHDVKIRGNYAYLATDSYQLRVLDISNVNYDDPDFRNGVEKIGGC